MAPGSLCTLCSSPSLGAEGWPQPRPRCVGAPPAPGLWQGAVTGGPVGLSPPVLLGPSFFPSKVSAAVPTVWAEKAP